MVPGLNFEIPAPSIGFDILKERICLSFGNRGADIWSRKDEHLGLAKIDKAGRAMKRGSERDSKKHVSS